MTGTGWRWWWGRVADALWPGGASTAERARSGIPLPPAVVAELGKVGELTGAPFDVQPKMQAGAAA